jgi:threonine dehydratase
MRQGRILHLTVHMDNRPGTLARLISLITQLKGNITNVQHNQNECGAGSQMIRVEIEIETLGKEHAAEIRKALTEKGYELMEW